MTNRIEPPSAGGEAEAGSGSTGGMRGLSELLRVHAPYWQEMAYYRTELAWTARHPELTEALLALAPAAVGRLSGDGAALSRWLTPMLPLARELHQAAQLPRLAQQALPPVNPRFHAGIPGRKWQQIAAFAACVPVSAPLLEWCAGKSYLGFYLQQLSDCPVTALEWDAALVAAANARAQRLQVPLKSYPVDVLSEQAQAHLPSAGQVVALHACGELHERLLRLGVQHQVPELHLAPCCYHKRAAAEYLPLSRQGAASGLRFSQQELHTAVMETATASAGVQRQRQRLQSLRLGFDALQRELRGVDEYLPVPSLPASWARAEFEPFCRHCAALTGIELPAKVAWERFERAGEQRFWQVAALDLVRLLFRRPLEVWLAWDRAAYLQEAGYEVRVGSFCPAEVTPRNILIQAWRA